MKTYEKPKLAVLSFTAYDALCASCSVATRFSPDISSVIENEYPDAAIDHDGFLTVKEAEIIGLFEEGACQNTYGGYCKFVPDGNSLFIS